MQRVKANKPRRIAKYGLTTLPDRVAHGLSLGEMNQCKQLRLSHRFRHAILDVRDDGESFFQLRNDAQFRVIHVDDHV
jgi:hypothetical protein